MFLKFCYNKSFIFSKNNVCNATRNIVSMFHPLFASVMKDMTVKLDEKFSSMSFDESIDIYKSINEGAEADFVNLLMAQNKVTYITEVCLNSKA